MSSINYLLLFILALVVPQLEIDSLYVLFRSLVGGSILCLHCKMATFHAKSKPKLTILSDDYGITHVIEKCLCAMFGFRLETMHISKDDMYDDNNNVIRFVYQALLLSAQGLEWSFQFRKFEIVGKNFPKSS